MVRPGCFILANVHEPSDVYGNDILNTFLYLNHPGLHK